MIGELPPLNLKRRNSRRSEGEHQPFKRLHPSSDVANEFEPVSPSKSDGMKSLDFDQELIEVK